jgi:hypothetical protein
MARQVGEVASLQGRSAEACIYLRESLHILEAINSPHADSVRQVLAAYGCPTA